jgi:CRISPR/Cas system-associated exonuclease Cas4 (RecB family)
VASKQLSIHRPSARELPVLLPASHARATMVRPTPEHPLIVSASELRDFLRCRVKWWWRHQARIEQVTGAPALAFGSVIHEILEEWYKVPPKLRGNIKRMEKLAQAITRSSQYKELDDADYELINAMCVGYAAWAEQEDLESGVDVCTPEVEFDLPLIPDGSIRVRGRIDNVFEPTNLKKTMACMEFKSKKQIDTSGVDLLLQLSVYLWALRQLYPKRKRYIAHYTILRKQMPGPRVKADLFHRESVERTDEEIDQWALDTARAALDMLDAAIYPNPMDACSWDCDFKMPCMLRGRPEDLKHVLTTEYKMKEAR